MALPAHDSRRQFAPVGDADLDRYASTAARLVLAARLNKYFPDPFTVSQRLSLLAPSACHGVHTQILIDPHSGMPSLKDILRIQIDREVAGKFLEAQEDRISIGRTPTARSESKMAYYRMLIKADLPPIGFLSVTLRRVDRSIRSAAFEVVIDRYDPAETVFVRYTISIVQNDKIWGNALLERKGDYSRPTEDLRREIEKCAQDDSEITFLLMGKHKDIRIEEVVRGRIGPMWSAWAPSPPDWMPDSDRPTDFVLHCPLDRASIHEDRDRDDDPFSAIYRQFLSPSSRSVVEDCARSLGYRVHKDRKFACTAKSAGALRRKLDEAGTKNVVYALEN